MNNNDDNKLFDLIWSVFVMVCVTATVIYIAYSFYSKRIEQEPGERPQVQQDLIEIKKVE